jgi:putative DNA primase/helicase
MKTHMNELSAIQTDETKSESESEFEFEGGKPHYWSKPSQGLFWETYEKQEDGRYKPEKKRIGNHLVVKAWIDHLESSEVSLLIEFQDAYLEIKQMQIERTLIFSNQKLFEKLSSVGYTFKVSLKCYIPKYLMALAPPIRYQITSRTGWDDAKLIYITPNRTYGNPNLFHKTINRDPNSPFNSKGTLEEWQTSIAIPSLLSSRLIFSIGCALAAPLLTLFDIESGGFHFWSTSSDGKTLTLKVATSVIGKPDKYIKRWRATSNGLESIAESHNDLLLTLDELAQIDSKDVGNTIYMLANGKGKVRANSSGNAQATKEWKILLLSSGEISIKQKISECKTDIKAGQEVRLTEIPACHDEELGFGIFESIKGYESSKALLEALESASNTYYGSPFDRFISKLISVKNDEWISEQAQFISDFSKSLTKNYPHDHVICRVAKRFSLICLALKLAIDWDILPSSHYTQKEVSQVVTLVFEDWINHRGGAGNIEIKQAVERLNQLFQSNIHGNRIVNIEGNSIISSSTSSSRLLAFKKGDKLYIPPNIFENELCRGINKRQFIEALEQEKFLVPSTDPNRQTSLKQIKGERKRYYVINDVFSLQSFPLNS